MSTPTPLFVALALAAVVIPTAAERAGHHLPAAAQAAQRAADEDGTDPRPIRQLDQECWAAARDGYLVEDDDLGLVHHCTEGEARAATGPAGDDTAPPAEPASGSVDGEGLHPFHRS